MNVRHPGRLEVAGALPRFAEAEGVVLRLSFLEGVAEGAEVALPALPGRLKPPDDCARADSPVRGDPAPRDACAFAVWFVCDAEKKCCPFAEPLRIVEGLAP